MAIEVKCPGCGTKYRLADSAGGKTLRCKNAQCGAKIAVPLATPVEEELGEFAEVTEENDVPILDPIAPPARPRSALEARLPAAPVGRTTSAALTSMILGFFSFGCAFLTGIPAIILGIVALVKVNRSRGQLRGTGMAITGIALGFCGSLFMATIVAFLYPAYQAAQEAGRRTASMNHLKIIGLAMHNYHDVWRYLPPGGIVDQNGQDRHGWQAMLLPYIEQHNAVYQKIDFNVPWTDPKNLAPLQTQIEEYLAPGIEEKFDPSGYALSHYAGNSHVFGKNTSFGMRDFTGGTSSAMLVGEAAGNFKPWGHPENWRDPAKGFNTGPDSFGRPSSLGVNILMADGAVRFMSSNQDPEILKALANPTNPQVIFGGDGNH